MSIKGLLPLKFIFLIIIVLNSIIELRCEHPLPSHLAVDPDLELRLVQVIARHGARAPEHPYPTDPLNDELKYWPNGWGQLTEIGKEEQFRLGQFFRKRYSSFLSSKYSTNKEVYVLSSGYERTIQSAQIAMAGLFAEGITENSNLAEEQVRVKDFISSMVPIHSIPRKYGKIIQPFQQCPRLKQIFKEVLTTHPTVLDSNERNKEFIAEFGKNLGMQGKSIFSIGTGINALLIEDAQNLSTPTWAKPFISSEKNLAEIYFIYTMFTLTETQRRLSTGPLLTEIMKNMKSKISGNETRKFIYYSGHDLNIANVMNTLGVFKIHQPAFSSCLIFELYFRNSTQEYVVKLWYKYSLKDDLRNIQIPNCNDTVNNASVPECKFDKFSEVIRPFFVDDLDDECRIKSFAEKHIGITTLDAVLILVIALLITLFLVSQMCHYRKNKREYNTVKVHIQSLADATLMLPSQAVLRATLDSTLLPLLQRAFS